MKVTNISLTSSCCQTDGASDRPVFGISVSFENGKTAVCRDLGDDQHKVERLCRLLKKADLELENMSGIFEDFIQTPH